MINVSIKNLYDVGCIYSTQSAQFDGINDYAIGNTDSHWPQYKALSGATNRVVASLWVKSDFTTSQAGLKFIMGQNAGGLGSGDSNNQFFRIAYWPENSSGTDFNRLIVTYRDNTTSNMIEKQYGLHDNTGITGSTSPADKWLVNNTNINTNENGFVHLCVVMDIPPLGVAYGVAGTINTYWNGQLLTNTAVYTRTGAAGGGQTSVYGVLGTNAANLLGFWHGKIDEMLTLEASNYTNFMSLHSLSTPQDLATYLWNDGCPVDTMVTGDYQVGSYRFEGNWDSEYSFNPFPFTPAGGAIISSDHA